MAGAALCVQAGPAGQLAAWIRRYRISQQTVNGHQVTSFADLGKEMWSYLTGKGAAINYEFVDMIVEVPRETGAEAPRATWRLNGTLRITTTEGTSAG